jgi:hypothetical protein
VWVPTYVGMGDNALVALDDFRLTEHDYFSLKADRKKAFAWDPSSVQPRKTSHASCLINHSSVSRRCLEHLKAFHLFDCASRGGRRVLGSRSHKSACCTCMHASHQTIRVEQHRAIGKRTL